MGKLKDRAIRNAKIETGEKFLSDGEGLNLRVRADGSLTWFYRYSRDGKQAKMQLGTYPQMPLAEAREIASDLNGKRRRGIDPLAERNAERQAAEEEAVKRAARLSVQGLFERWERLALSARKDKGAEIRRSFEKDVLPKLGAMIAEDVTRAMIANVLDAVVERGARIVARNLLGDIRQMFGFGIARGLLENDPTSHMKRDDFGRKVERERVLSDAEIRELNRKLPDADMWELRIPTIVTGCTDDRDRWLSADAWCSNSTPVGHDAPAQGCPQANASAPLTLAGGRLWGTRV